MAPSANRRSGYSRRAQYSTFFGYIAGVVGVAVGAVLLVVSMLYPGTFSGLRNLASDATAPAGEATATTRQAGQDAFSVVKGYILAGSENARLRRELREVSARLAEADAQAEENRRLKTLLGLAEAEPRPVTFARLTSSSASSTRRFATLNAGWARGVTVGMPVRSTAGVVGRVLEVGRTTARVLLVTDTESIVPVRRAADGVAAFAQGRGDGTLQLRLLSLGINPLRKGDMFVTSGSGGLYRPGMAVAAVTAITRDGAIARVISDPAATDYVAVERVWSPEAAQAAPPAAPEEGGAP